jgi:hypothetical protein
MLRRSFGPKWDEVRREWRTLHYVELKYLYSSCRIFRVIKSRTMRLVRCLARIGERRVVQRDLVENPEGRRPLGTPRLRWVSNIRMDFRK